MCCRETGYVQSQMTLFPPHFSGNRLSLALVFHLWATHSGGCWGAKTNSKFSEIFAFALCEVHCATCIANLSASRPFNCLTASQLWFGCHYLVWSPRSQDFSGGWLGKPHLCTWHPRLILLFGIRKDFPPLPLQNVLTYGFSKRSQGDLLKRALNLDPVASAIQYVLAFISAPTICFLS